MSNDSTTLSGTLRSRGSPGPPVLQCVLNGGSVDVGTEQLGGTSAPHVHRPLRGDADRSRHARLRRGSRTPPAAAVPATPPAPSAKEVARSRQTVQSKAMQVGRIKALLAQAGGELER